ncbi:MAG: DUF2802 domain-containing protein [Dethiobacteria bacterium]
MGLFIAGVLLGLALGCFWFYQLNPTRGFQQLLQKEVDLSSYADLLNQACQRLDSLEERCCYLEKSFAGAAEKRSFREAGLTGRDEPGRRREQAIMLWEEGRELNEIVRRTGLSKGEIELILSLQERH